MNQGEQLSEQQRIIIEAACLRLVTAYCHFVDHGEASKIATLFTEDGVIWSSQGSPPVLMEGRDSIRAHMQAREDNKSRMSRHVCNNFLLDEIGMEEAKGIVYVTLYRHEGEIGREVSQLHGPYAVGEYRDHFVATRDGWKIKRREFFADFIREEAE